MPPNDVSIVQSIQTEQHAYERVGDLHKEEPGPSKKTYTLKKWNIFFVAIFHLFALYGIFTKLTVVKWQTFLWNYLFIFVGGFGISAGIHRFWSHKSFKAKLPLKILLAFAYLTAGQIKIVKWVRDHRVHHKFSETDADPHDVRRGFFFTHVGWFLCEKNPQVMEKGQQLDLSDIEKDPVARFHDKHFEILRLIFCYTLPTLVPVYFWDEDLWIAFLANCVRYVWLLNMTWSINSFNHSFGLRPYDRKLMPTENCYVSFFALGEGWHNYHHVFPFDYRSSELAHFLNPTKKLIEFFAKIGWAYDLRVASDEAVKRRIFRTGDGTHRTWGTVNGVPIYADENETGY